MRRDRTGEGGGGAEGTSFDLSGARYEASVQDGTTAVQHVKCQVVRGSRIRGGHPTDGLSRGLSGAPRQQATATPQRPLRIETKPCRLPSRLYTYIHTVLHTSRMLFATVSTPDELLLLPRLQKSKQRGQGETGRRRGMHSGMAWCGLIGGRQSGKPQSNRGQRHYLDIQQLTQGGHCQ